MENDRRVQRTRELLKKALMELLAERRYASITIQDIVDRANVGRTTFYLHYINKDELFISCHEAKVNEFRPELLYPLSREALLSPDAPPGMTAAFQHLDHARAHLYSVFHDRENVLLLQRIRDENAQKIEANLHIAFANAESAIPFDVLANYLAGAHIALMQWWLDQRQPHTPEAVAQAFHRLQRAAICDAFGLT
jgi:AcrR family transcriptional regulator